MSGLDYSGFTVRKIEEIKEGIESNLEVLNPGFDFTPESPDGQLIGIMAEEIQILWNELSFVYESFDPQTTIGQGLRNIGFISGIEYGVALRSRTSIDITGVSGTLVPVGSEVSDGTNIFQTSQNAVIPSNVEVLSVVAGPLPIGAGTLTTIVSTITGWTGIDQPLAGIEGKLAQSDSEYRNTRNSAAMGLADSVADSLESKLVKAGLQQVRVLNNDFTVNLPDGTPPGYIHITIGDPGDLTDDQIARLILDYKNFGVLTYGTTTRSPVDSHGGGHNISFTKSIAAEVFINLDVTYLEESATATEDIRAALVEYINNLQAGEDVIWSRLFGIITPFGKAQIDSLLIGRTAGTMNSSNITISQDEHGTTSTGNINITS